MPRHNHNHNVTQFVFALAEYAPQDVLMSVLIPENRSFMPTSDMKDADQVVADDKAGRVPRDLFSAAKSTAKDAVMENYARRSRLAFTTFGSPSGVRASVL